MADPRNTHITVQEETTRGVCMTFNVSCIPRESPLRKFRKLYSATRVAKLARNLFTMPTRPNHVLIIPSRILERDPLFASEVETQVRIFGGACLPQSRTNF
jgi:hypothetical protein